MAVPTGDLYQVLFSTFVMISILLMSISCRTYGCFQELMSHRKRAEEADEPCGSAAVGQQNACKEAWHTCKLCGDRKILRDKYWIAGERPRSYQAMVF